MKKLLLVLAVFLLVVLVAPQAVFGGDTSPFEATFEGDFRIESEEPPAPFGKSPRFLVKEEGTGESTLGAFTFDSTLPHNYIPRPPGCGPNSSTANGGSSVLTFVDGSGQLNLVRISGTACFSFPTVVNEEKWVIAGGTGNYIGASGKLSRHLDGDVRFYTAVGTISGYIKLP